MMKATAWFCPVLLTLLSATRLVCTAQRGAATGAGGVGAAGGAGYANGYPLDYQDVRAIQDEYSFSKRNKPSLSIVNPLDVLRQRLLLEIARRQMKENTRQVELNRAILKNVGKRMFPESATWSNSRYQQQQDDQQEQQQEQKQAAMREQLRREQLQQQHFPSQLWSNGWSQSAGSPSYLATSASASSRFFDFLQQPETSAVAAAAAGATRQQPANQQLLNDANKSLNAGALGLRLGLGVTQHQQTANGNEILNETNHENGNRKLLAAGQSATGDVDNDDEDNVADDQDDVLDELNLSYASEQPGQLDSHVDMGNVNGRVPWHLLYCMHKNPHYAN